MMRTESEHRTNRINRTKQTNQTNQTNKTGKEAFVMSEMLLDRYHKAIDDLFAKVRATQRENIIRAGEIVADSVRNGGCIFLSGICHSMEMDSIYRGGGPIFYKHFSYDLKVESPSRARDRSDLGYERQTAAAAKYALTQSSVRPGDVLFVSSVSGRTVKVVDVRIYL